VHDHPRRLVDHDEVLVLVHDLERDRLADDLAAGRLRHVDHDGLAAAQTQPRLLAPAVDQRLAVREERRGLGAGEAEPLGDEEIERKLQLAAETFRAHRRTPFQERREKMTRAAEILESDKDRFARAMTVEMGKPIKAAEEEAAKCAAGCRWYAEHGPSFVADEVIDDSAIEFNQEPEDSGEVIDEFKKFLENVSPEDFGN
jgi:acyl-CoA reductase-like NAD-dependent aldehyde dehydrogenase